VIDELPLDLQLPQRLGNTEEVEQVRIAGGLLSQVGVARRHHRREIGDGLPRPSMQLTVDLQSQDVAAPSLRNRLRRVPEPHFRLAQLVEEHHVMAPGQLCCAALHNCRIRPRRGERPHVLEVARRVPPRIGEPFPQVDGQSVDDLRAPAFLCLARQDVRSNRPVGGDQLTIRCPDSAAVAADHPASSSSAARAESGRASQISRR
jgi:hypothetical protein